ncbi:MAG: hypothetical protein JWP94_3429 [Mucilaginibacter sp.]|nr:hypothetical protein [Mucilaginibacter sp.]
MKGIALIVVVLILSFDKSFSSSNVDHFLITDKLCSVSSNTRVRWDQQKKDSGVVVLKESYQDKLVVLRMYNKNGSVWLSFKFTDDFNSKLLNPLSLKTDDGILVFKCVGEDKNFYAVVVSQDKNLIKFIKKSDSNFLFQTWQKRILSVFSVDFDGKKNPLRERPSIGSKQLHYRNNDFYHPVSINGDWLKVKSNETNQTGWIKWRDSKGQMLIDLIDEA